MTKATLLSCLLLFLSACNNAPEGDLSAAFLLGDTPMQAPVTTLAFQPLESGQTRNRFEGLLEFQPVRGGGNIEVLTDWFDYAVDSNHAVADLPRFRFEFVQHENTLIPVKREPEVSNHPHWEFIPQPGRAWDQAGDGDWTRASLPFALQERNANCIHNGLMTFLFRDNGSVSRIAYEVSSETCQYFQANLWGVLPAHYTPGDVANADEIIEGFRVETAARLPVKPLTEIASDYPGIDAGNFNWFPSDEVSTVGFAIDGVHYSGGCNTRHGAYPYCEVLALPSYSLAKSIFGGLAGMLLEQEFPGAGSRLRVSDYVPECQDERWHDVTLDHLLDMTSGNFESTEHNVDEYVSYDTDFMGGETHDLKINMACTLFPRKAKPGSTFSYHTSDTYIAGTLMNSYLASLPPQDGQNPPDIHTDYLYKKLFKPLGLSPLTQFTRRTYDATGQPFTGYGLTLSGDDIARVGLFLAAGTGRVDGTQVLDQDKLHSALHRGKQDSGLPGGSPDTRYSKGFWAYRSDLHGACDEPVWIPFMSGYGGISVAILPNHSLFYVFSDHGRFEWLKAAIESNKIRGFCQK